MEKSDNTASSINFASLMKLFWSHKKFIGIFVAVSLVLTILLSFIMPYEYKTFTTVFPPEQGSSSGLSSFLQGMSGVISLGGSFDKFSKSKLFLEIIKSREVSQYIVEHTEMEKLPKFKELGKETLGYIAGSFVDPYVNNNGMIIVETTVSTGWFPSDKEKEMTAEFSAEAANTAVEGLDLINRQKNTSSAKSVKNYVETILIKKRIQLDSLENEIEKFQKEHNILSISDQSQAMLSEAIKIGSQLAEAEVKLQVLLHEYSENSPVIKAYKKKIAELEEQYQNVQKGGLTGSEEFSIPLAEIPSLTRKYTDLMRDRKILEKIVIYLESQRFEEAVKEQRDLPTVEVLDEALVPPGPSAPKRKVMIVLAIVLSSFFAMLTVLVYAFIKGKINLKQERSDDYYRSEETLKE